MSSSRELVTIAIVFAGIVLAVVGPRAVHSDVAALAVIGVGLALAMLAPVALFGVDTLLNGTRGDIERAVDYRSTTVAWYATMVVLLAATLSLEYLPPWLAAETLLWGAFFVALLGKAGANVYFERAVPE